MMTWSKKLRKGAWIGIILLGAISARPAHAIVNLSVMGGINDTINNGGGLGYLGGIGLNFGLVPMVHLEVDGLFVSRAFTGFSNINWIEVPVLVRFHLMPSVSFGVGGFYDFAVSTGAPTNDGLVGSVRFKGPGMPLFVDGRFNLGLNQGIVPTASGLNEFQLMIGFMF